ncbi:hypothetical protein AB0O52_13720 [Arthrobacter sp. NPDC080073]|uniref:hypothetical protein n=1 Tax=Arthrobacter sp. NPDC080073 TaxID=3155919 RepID=UPI003424A4E3
MEAEQSKSRVLHILRSIMLAGAGAVVWMALSSTAANADSGSANNHNLPGGAGSAVSNVVHHEVHPPAVQVPAVAVHELPKLSRSVDQLAASTPVVSAVVPEGTVGAVTTRVVSPAASAVDGVGARVGSLVGSLQVTIPQITVPSVQIPDAVGTGEALAGEPAAVEPAAVAPPTPAQDVAAPMLDVAGPSGPPVLDGTLSTSTVRATNSEVPSAPAPGGTIPPGTPGGSDAGNSSAVLTSNPSGAATAWLQGTILFYPLTGTLVSTAAAGRVPAPVSFDPGSSPD